MGSGGSRRTRSGSVSGGKLQFRLCDHCEAQNLLCSTCAFPVREGGAQRVSHLCAHHYEVFKAEETALAKH